MSQEEQGIVSALSTLCQELGVTCLVQVGAEDGFEADSIREATGCRAIAIEGLSNCKPYSDKLEYHYAIIGATNCVMPFYDYGPGLSSQVPRKDIYALPYDIIQTRLDTFCNERGIVPDALIIDTEGTTLDVLEGCGDLLDGIKIIYCEVQSPQYALEREGSRPFGEVDTFLSSRGFAIRNGYPNYCAGPQANVTWIRK